MRRPTVGRSWVDQMRPLMIVWLLLTLPVVCHHETAVVLLTAASAGHEHQRMMAETAGEPRVASAAHQHGSREAHAWAGEPSQAPRLAAPAADDLLTVTHTATGPPLQWRAYQATPASQGLPAADGVAFSVPTGWLPPARLESPLSTGETMAPDPQRRAPPAPPPRILLG
jgi:hypothetical protein